MTSTAISAQGTTFSINTGTIQTPVWTAIANVKTFSGSDAAAPDIDCSNLTSTKREYRVGLTDNGTFTLEVDRDSTDVGQVAVVSALDSGDETGFQIELPNNDTATFQGYVKKFSIAGGVDKTITGSMEIRVTGAITWA